jgi:hypothetical protein
MNWSVCDECQCGTLITVAVVDWWCCVLVSFKALRNACSYAAKLVFEAALNGRGIMKTAHEFNRTIGDVTGVCARGMHVVVECGHHHCVRTQGR